MKTTTHRGANHILHIFLSIITCGMWAITGWPIAAMMGRKTTVDTRMPQYPQPAQWPVPTTSHDQYGRPTYPVPNVYSQPVQYPPHPAYHPPRNPQR